MVSFGTSNFNRFAVSTNSIKPFFALIIIIIIIIYYYYLNKFSFSWCAPVRWRCWGPLPVAQRRPWPPPDWCYSEPSPGPAATRNWSADKQTKRRDILINITKAFETHGRTDLTYSSKVGNEGADMQISSKFNFPSLLLKLLILLSFVAEMILTVNSISCSNVCLSSDSNIVLSPLLQGSSVCPSSRSSFTKDRCVDCWFVCLSRSGIGESGREEDPFPSLLNKGEPNGRTELVLVNNKVVCNWIDKYMLILCET